MISTHEFFYSTRLYAGYRRNILNHVFVMDEIVILRTEKQTSCLTLVTRFGWKGLAYLAEIFERFKAEGKGLQTSFSFATNLQALYSKLRNWLR